MRQIWRHPHQKSRLAGDDWLALLLLLLPLLTMATLLQLLRLPQQVSWVSKASKARQGFGRHHPQNCRLGLKEPGSAKPAACL